MEMGYDFITVESAMWHSWYFGIDIICDADTEEVDCQDCE